MNKDSSKTISTTRSSKKKKSYSNLKSIGLSIKYQLSIGLSIILNVYLKYIFKELIY